MPTGIGGEAKIEVKERLWRRLKRVSENLQI